MARVKQQAFIFRIARVHSSPQRRVKILANKDLEYVLARPVLQPSITVCQYEHQQKNNR